MPHLRACAFARRDAPGAHSSALLQFEDEFLKLLSRRYGERRVPANEVYNEFIKDRHHVHMNATMWTTLSNFVQYLGRASKCVVEETEKVRLACSPVAALRVQQLTQLRRHCRAGTSSG